MSPRSQSSVPAHSSVRCPSSTANPSTATVATLERTGVLVLTTAAFNDVVAMMPSVDRKMLTVLAGRLWDIEGRYVPANERRDKTTSPNGGAASSTG